MSEDKYTFTIDKLISLDKIIKDIENYNYIDGYIGYEYDFYIDSILYYLKENKHLQSVINKAIEYIENNKNKTMYSITGEDVDFEICLFESDIDELQEILRSKE